jgi:hypothetical protein
MYLAKLTRNFSIAVIAAVAFQAIILQVTQ